MRDNPLATPRSHGPSYVSTRWAFGPGPAGWYLVHRRIGTRSDVMLVLVEGEACFDESGDELGPPNGYEFRLARWIGPVEKP